MSDCFRRYAGKRCGAICGNGKDGDEGIQSERERENSDGAGTDLMALLNERPATQPPPLETSTIL